MDGSGNGKSSVPLFYVCPGILLQPHDAASLAQPQCRDATFGEFQKTLPGRNCSGAVWGWEWE